MSDNDTIIVRFTLGELEALTRIMRHRRLRIEGYWETRAKTTIARAIMEHIRSTGAQVP